MALNALLACLAMVEAAGMAGMARKKKINRIDEKNITYFFVILD
jgi:hypothetical protein